VAAPKSSSGKIATLGNFLLFDSCTFTLALKTSADFHFPDFCTISLTTSVQIKGRFCLSVDLVCGKVEKSAVEN